jgi:hypothetical protein
MKQDVGGDSGQSIWLQGQIARVTQFIQRDEVELQKKPGCASLHLSLDSWRQHHKELTDDLSALQTGKSA